MILAVILGYTSRTTYAAGTSVGMSFRTGPSTTGIASSGTLKHTDDYVMNRIGITSDSLPDQKPPESPEHVV